MKLKKISNDYREKKETHLTLLYPAKLDMRMRYSVFGCLSLVFVLAALYWPAINANFGFHNDYRCCETEDNSFNTSKLSGMLKHKESMQLLYVGRPINAFAFNLHQSFFHKVSDFFPGRLVSLGLVLVFAGILFFFLTYRLGIGAPSSFILSLAIFTLPSFQLYILWVANFVPGIVGIGLSIAAFLVIIGPATDSRAMLSISNWVRLSVAFALLLVALYNYPATALFPLLFLFCFVLFIDQDVHRIERAAIRIGLFILIAFAFYYISHKFVYFPLMHSYWGDKFKTYDTQTYVFSLGLNYRTIVYLGELLRYGFSVWQPKDDAINFTVLNVTVTLLAPLFWLCLSDPMDSRMLLEKARMGLRRLRLAGIVAAATLAPFIITPTSFVAYRIEVAWFAVICIVIVASYLLLFRIVSLFIDKADHVLKLSLVLVLSLITLTDTKAIAINEASELTYIREQLKPLSEITKIRPATIALILPVRYSLFVNHDLFLDLTYTATNYSGLMPGTVEMVADEMNVHRDRYSYYSIDPQEPILKDKPDIVIDMRIPSRRQGIQSSTVL